MGKPDTLIVRAADPEKPVLMPGHPLREFDAQGRDRWAIRADEPVEVENNAFYRRRIRMGDLVVDAPVKLPVNTDASVRRTAKE